MVYCSVCGDELSRETVTVSPIGHSFTNYASDNNATCLVDGTKTAKCDHCDETDTIADEGSALGHDIIHHEGKASTCIEKGYAEYNTCSRCDYTTYFELPLAEHTPATAVKENKVDATCEKAGKYDSVVYCSLCGDELSRKTETIAKIGHTDTNNDGMCDTCKTVTDKEKYNKYLVGKAKLKVPANTDVEYGASVTVIAKATGVPSGYYVALYDGGTLLAKGSNTEVSYTIPGEFTSTKNIIVKIIDGKGNVQKDSSGKDLTGTVEIKAKSGFFAKLIAFFKRLFKALPSVEVKPK